jgi:hypothetical protein
MTVFLHKPLAKGLAENFITNGFRLKTISIGFLFFISTAVDLALGITKSLAKVIHFKSVVNQ